MRRVPPAVLALAGATALAAPPAQAQGGYRILLDSRIQRVSFRGWEGDSVLASTIGTGPTGGFQTSDGFAATCPTGDRFCYFFRPGARQDAVPVTTTADVTLWGLGVPGLRAHGKMRVNANGNATQWPGLDPAVQLFEGFLEYSTPALTGRLGRQTFVSRLGFAGFDGARVAVRAPGAGLEVTAYGGLGLARGAAIGINNAITQPLGDFFPPQSHLVAGAQASWVSRLADARIEYQRQIDRVADKFMSERASASLSVRPAAQWLLTGGVDYDFGQGIWGSADLSLRYQGARVQASAMARRYQPYFDLWTIWPAFSPAAHNGLVGSLQLTPVRGLLLRGRGEVFRFENQGSGRSPLVNIEGDGWRWAAGASFTRIPRWTVEGGYSIEFGPGAAGSGFDGAVSYRPTPDVALRLHGATLARPLEYRFNDARVRWAGAELDVRATRTVGFGLQGTYITEDRQRPDAASLDWNQLRLSARVTLLLDVSGADRLALPRATRRTPSSLRLGQ